MGMMSQILEGEKKNLRTAGRAEAESFADQIPCRKCNCGWFWESIYGDGVLRCVQCEPFPSWDFVGRKVSQVVFPNADGTKTITFEQRRIDGVAPGSAPEKPLAEEQTDTLALADQFVEYLTADRRTAYALRGFDSPKHRNYDQRACMYAAIGVAEYDKSIEEIQAELRAKILQ